MLRIKLVDDTEIIETVRLALKENSGYCPCSLFKSEDTRCMCREFREKDTPGTCHCGLYEKVEVIDE